MPRARPPHHTETDASKIKAWILSKHGAYTIKGAFDSDSWSLLAFIARRVTRDTGASFNLVELEHLLHVEGWCLGVRNKVVRFIRVEAKREADRNTGPLAKEAIRAAKSKLGYRSSIQLSAPDALKSFNELPMLAPTS